MRIIKLTVLALCLGVSVVWADDRPIYKDKNAPIEDRSILIFINRSVIGPNYRNAQTQG